MQQETVETISGISAKLTVGGAGGAVYFGLTSSELAAWAGVIVALIGVLINAAVNIYFKHKTLKITEKRLREIAEE